MHPDDLWLATDLRMDRHGKDEALIGLVGKVKLLEPQSLHFVSADEAVLQFFPVSVAAIAIRDQRKGSEFDLLYQLFPAWVAKAALL